MMEQTQYDDGASAIGGFGGFDSTSVLRKISMGLNRQNSSIQPPTLKEKKGPKRQNTAHHYRRTISSIQPDTIEETDENDGSSKDLTALTRQGTKKLPIRQKLTNQFLTTKKGK